MKVPCMQETHGILKAIFRLFLNQGGKFIQTNVKTLEQIHINETAIRCENNEYRFEKIVVATGAFLKTFN